MRLLGLSALAVILSGLILPVACAQDSAQQPLEVIYFHSPSCQHCIKIKNEFLPQVKNKFKDKISIDYRDISDIENYKFLLALKKQYSVEAQFAAPVIFVAGACLAGEDKIIPGLIGLIENNLSLPSPPQRKTVNGIDLVKQFLTFSPLAVIGAGLVDGINPCAFTVIVFFVSFLALQGYRKREVAAIGASFICAVFITYILIGLGLFNFLYSLKGFQHLARAINLSVGALSIALGALALYDLFKFSKSRSTQGLILQLPQAVKNRIHAIVGMHYRRRHIDSGPALEAACGAGIGRLVLSAFITGFLVSVLEAICTGQVYLPTVVFVLKTAPFKLAASGYLLLYNLMFILPLCVIFIFALLGRSSAQFSNLLHRHMLLVKALLAAVFLGLGMLVLSGCATGKEQAPALTQPADPFTWDFGQVREGEITEHKFIFKNEGQKALAITNIQTSCGCTASKVGKKTLLPQEVTTIEVKFDSKGYSGLVQQYVYLHTDSLDNPLFRFIIKATVVK